MHTSHTYSYMHTYIHTYTHKYIHTYTKLYMIITTIETDTCMLSCRYGSIQSDIGYYSARVGQVVSNANSFYASVAGAAGVMRWLADNIDLGVIGGSLCGHSSPNWCDFSPVGR